MKKKLLSQPLCLGAVLVAAFITGCASTPKSAMTIDQVLAQDDVKNKPATVFNQPLAKTHEAAIRALNFVGCQIKQNETYFVSGERPRKFGLFVGSGGETVQVFLVPKSGTETHVWVDTDLTFVGMAGQQGWDKQVLDEMKNILSK